MSVDSIKRIIEAFRQGAYSLPEFFIKVASLTGKEDVETVFQMIPVEVRRDFSKWLIEYESRYGGKYIIGNDVELKPAIEIINSFRRIMKLEGA